MKSARSCGGMTSLLSNVPPQPAYKLTDVSTVRMASTASRHRAPATALSLGLRCCDKIAKGEFSGFAQLKIVRAWVNDTTKGALVSKPIR
jgi:hypothetical protein